jgi:hypothetical protein
MMFLILLFSKLAHAPTGDFEKIDAVCEDMSIPLEMLDVACDIERAARDTGVKEDWFIKGLIANAYAESTLNPDAISPGKKSFGIFQLHVSGMGKGWEYEEMKDVRLSTFAIVSEAKKMGIYKKKRNSHSATSFLCTRVLRPANSHEQVEKRIDILENLFEK